MLSAEVCRLSQIHRWEKQESDKKRLAEYGSEVLCFMSDEDVAEMAKKNGTTRAVASMDTQLHWEERLSLQLEMHRQHWYGFMS